MAGATTAPNATILELLVKCGSDASNAPQLWAAIDAETPMGFTLLSALACPNFPTQGLDNLIGWMTQQGGQAEDDAHMLMSVLCNGVISEASFTMGEMGLGDQSGMAMAGLPQRAVQPRDLTTMMLNLARSKVAAEVLAESPFFVPLPEVKGGQLASATLLGAYLASRNPLGFAPMQQSTILRLMAVFPTDKAGQVTPEQHEAHTEGEAQLRHRVTDGAQAFKSVCEAFLRAGPKSRVATLQFLSAALTRAEAHRKSMVKHDEELHEITATILCHACVQLSLPVFASRSAASPGGWFPRQVPAEYFMQPPPSEGGKAWCAFSPDEERIMSGESAVDPPCKGEAPAGEYPPKMHLFALGIRALACFVNPTYRRWHQLYQQLHYPGLKKRDRQVIVALHAATLALISDHAVLQDYVSLADAVSEWLACVLAVKASGAVPRPDSSNAAAAAARDPDDDGAAAASPSSGSSAVPASFAAWANLPLTIVDDVFALAKIFGGFDRRHPPLELGFYQLQHMAALMLVVMGDTQLFPKPHTHSMFPQFLALLTEPQLPLRNDFMNHPWFPVHVMRACVECYIAVQPCDHDRQNARYFLAHALKDLLKDPSLAESVKPRYNDDADVTLESLSSMVTAEANESLDHVFDALHKMRDIELANGRAPPAPSHEKFEEHQQHGAQVRNEVQRAMAAIDVFEALTQHFRKGMAKRLVIQQISAALMSFIVQLAGPSALELKIAEPQKYGFKPREMLESVVRNFVKFSNSEKFRHYCVQSVSSLDKFDAAVATICDRGLVPSDDAERLRRMATRIHETAEMLKHEDEILEDAPDWARCALMYDPLVDPVALPTTSEELTFVEREPIRHNLLTEKKHPFTREPLTMADVDAFNAKPEVARKIEDLKKRIAAWKEEATRAKMASA